MTTRPELTFDGRGINGPDKYRSRVATFSSSLDGATVKQYGALFAAAPELLAALEIMVRAFNVATVDPLVALASIEKARAALAKAGVK